MKRTLTRRMGKIINVYFFKDDIIVKICGYNEVFFDRYIADKL